MEKPSPSNSTNVRFSIGAGARTAAVAILSWSVLVGSLQLAGAIDRLADDIPWIAGFAAGVALLAYFVDAELRRYLEARSLAALAVGVALLAAAPAAPAWLLLMGVPPGLVLTAALLPRLRGVRLSSAAAASPGGRRGAP